MQMAGASGAAKTPADGAMADLFLRYDRYLVGPVNRMQILLDREVGSPRRTDSITEAAAIGCNNLERILEDAQFTTDLSTYDDAYPGTLNLLEDAEAFDQFLRLEREVLLKAGLSRSLVDTLLWRAGTAMLQPTDKTLVLKHLGDLRDAACGVATDLQQQMQRQLLLPTGQNQATENAARGRRKRNLRVCLIGLGGVIMVGANAGAIPFTMGISTFFSGVSVNIGAGLITAAAAQVMAG
jgi:hypothetical protein